MNNKCKLQLKINNVTEKLEKDLIQLKNKIEDELDKINNKRTNGVNYVPNRYGIVQSLATEIDMKSRELDLLYTLIEQLD